MFEGKEVVVFDLDGTLADLVLDWDIGMERLAKKFQGVSFDGCKSTTSITEIIEEILGKKSVREAYKIIREFERGCEIKPIGKTIKLAKELHKEGKKLAVLSNNCHKTIEEVLQKTGIANIFDFCIGREDVVKHKPDPEGLYKIMRHFKVPKERAVFIGNDSDVDLPAGKAAGVETILI